MDKNSFAHDLKDSQSIGQTELVIKLIKNVKPIVLSF